MLSACNEYLSARFDFKLGLIYTGERQICLKIRPKTLSGKGKPAAFALVHLPARLAVFISQVARTFTTKCHCVS